MKTIEMKYDAIIVLGSGVPEKGQPNNIAIRRLDTALKKESQATYLITSSLWTVHIPPLISKNGFPYIEADIMAEYLLNKGIVLSRIRTENYSKDTIGNAYFTRIMFTDSMKLSKLLVITSEFHMPRSREIFTWIYSLKPLVISYTLDFCTASDTGLDNKMITSRVRKEQKGIKRLRETKSKIKNLSTFHSSLYSEHDAYTFHRKIERAKGDELLTYR